jgi:hypothetical protein
MMIISNHDEDDRRTLEQNDRDDNANQRLREVSADTYHVAV